MTIQEIWKNVNVSTLLILPIFSKMAHNVKTKHVPKLYIPFIMLAYEYGLINTYLFDSESDSESDKIKTLKLVFNNTVLENLRLTDSVYSSLNDRICCYDKLAAVHITDDKVIYHLTIPEELYPDIEMITLGKYSKVSNEYKGLLKNIARYYPVFDNKIAQYIIGKNLPYAIVSKQKHMKEELVDALDVDLSNNQEFYTNFDNEKETFTI